MMGELNLFLSLQIKQTSNGTMINQQKYVKELLKRFRMDSAKPIDTPISPSTKLVMDDWSLLVEEKCYRGMIGSLLYLTASRRDIIFSVSLCACFQSKPKESHLKAVKRIFRYLKHTPDLALWYLRGWNFDLLDMLMLIMQASMLIEKAPQVWLIFLDPVWYLRQPRNNLPEKSAMCSNN